MSEFSSSLRGRCIFVVEDDYMIAQETVEMLLEIGAKVLGPVSSLVAALRLVEAESRIDCAMVDVNLGGEASWPLVGVLLVRGVPVLLATGYSSDAIPRAYAHLSRCEKPVTSQDITRALVQLLPGAGTPQVATS